jgi:penicillin-binding protein 2
VSGLIQKAFIKRYIAVAVLCALCMLMMGGRLVDLQIIHGEEYRSQTEKKVFRTTVVQAPRGEILDRYGRPLVTNRMGFTVQIDKMTMGTTTERPDPDLASSSTREGKSIPIRLPVGNPPFAFTCDNAKPRGPRRQRDS